MTGKFVLTIATGKKLYVDMAVNLARSFILWNRDTGITFCLATDLPDDVPADVKAYANIITLKPNELGEGFSTKLHLDKLAPNGQTLFIDSDCLIYGNLLPVFERFRGHQVSVVGGYITKGEWFGDIAAICKAFNVDALPKFNGGIYYLEQGAKAKEIYHTARKLEGQYDEIGFTRLRGRPNDEVIMALSMALHGQSPVADDGGIMSDPLSCPAPYSTNVVSGKTLLINPPPPHKLHQSWYPFHKVSPLVVHFLGSHHADYQYRHDVYRLHKIAAGNLNLLTETKALLLITYKARAVNYLKNKLRGLYHFIFGVRQVRPSDRI